MSYKKKKTQLRINENNQRWKAQSGRDSECICMFWQLMKIKLRKRQIFFTTLWNYIFFSVYDAMYKTWTYFIPLNMYAYIISIWAPIPISFQYI